MTPGQSVEFPETLIGWRRRKGISLEAIVSQTKIGRRYLEAIERGEFDKLPGGVYNLSYLRQYARAIQFDEEELVGFYRSVMGIEDQSLDAGQGARPPKGRVLDRMFLPWVMAKLRSNPH